MSLIGKVEEMKKAKIKAFERQYRAKYPDESREVIHALAEKKYKRAQRNMVSKAKVAFLSAVLSAGLILGAQAITNISTASTPQINYEYLTEEQRNVIDNLNGTQLEEYIASFDISAHPEYVGMGSDSSKAQEVNENSEEYLQDFRRFQEGLLPFFASYQVHPENYTEQQMLDALDASTQLLSRYTKNQIVNLMYRHNLSTSDLNEKLYTIPNPNQVNFFYNGDRNSLAVTEYADNGLINHGSVYTESNYFRDNGFDEAINNYFNIRDYLEGQQSHINPDSADRSHMDRTIELILGNNEVANQVANTEIVVQNHWFNPTPTYDFQYREAEKDKEVSIQNTETKIVHAEKAEQESPNLDHDDEPEL